MESIEHWLSNYAKRVEVTLVQFFKTLEEAKNPLSEELLKAMRYSALNGGKRLRAAMVYAAAGEKNKNCTDTIACLVEMIHTYSLIHDDLPAMDNDKLRRKKASCHIAFGEGMAILAGDALQAHAFDVLIHQEILTASKRLQLLSILSKAIGIEGMAGGQAMDLSAENKSLSEREIGEIHVKKTGALIQASLMMGGICGEVDQEKFKALDEFGKNIGLAFQIQDDLLDVYGETQKLGKRTGTDRPSGKASYPLVIGTEMSKKRVATLHKAAKKALIPWGEDAIRLQQIADYIVSRNC